MPSLTMRTIRLNLLLGLALACYLVTCFALSTFAQQSRDSVTSLVGASPTPLENESAIAPRPTAQPRDLTASVFDLETTLAEEAKAHREFLTSTIEQLKWFVGIILIVGGGILTVLNYKSREDIRAQVNARFKADVDALVKERVAQFEVFLEENKKRVEETAARLNSLTHDFGDLVEGLTLAFTALERTSDQKWDATRKASIQKLEALRSIFPTYRTIGILLGRLHMSFGEPEAAIQSLVAVSEERDKRKMPQDIDYAAAGRVLPIACSSCASPPLASF
jgi:cell division septum initiation protein DivIVA